MLHAYQMRQKQNSRYFLLFSNSDDKLFEPQSSEAEMMKMVSGKSLSSPFRIKHTHESTFWLLIISHTDVPVQGFWRI